MKEADGYRFRWSSRGAPLAEISGRLCILFSRGDHEPHNAYDPAVPWFELRRCPDEIATDQPSNQSDGEAM
jgi:hypothetical protein